MEMKYRPLVDELIEEAKHDDIGLWCVIAALRQRYGVSDSGERRRIAVEAVKAILESGQVVAAAFTPNDHRLIPWRMRIDDVVARIDSEWNMLGREPDIGDIVVFISPILL